jgi:hypothetical protein
MKFNKMSWLELVLSAVGIEAVGATICAALLFMNWVTPGGAALLFAFFTVMACVSLVAGGRALLKTKARVPVESEDSHTSGSRDRPVRDELHDNGEERATVGSEDAQPSPPPLNAGQAEWFEWYEQVTGGGAVKPDTPPADSPHDLWFHWFHYVTDVQGYRMTLKDLSCWMGLSYETVRKQHSDYQAQYGTKTEQK